MTSLFSALIFWLCISSCLSEQTPKKANAPLSSAYRYGYRGHSNPVTWGKTNRVCKRGKFQSPIDFVGNELLQPYSNHSVPDIEWFQEFNLIAYNTGNTIEFKAHPGFKFRTNFMSEAREYKLNHFHFHYPSEHTIDGKAYPLEAHLVFKDLYNNTAILGVFFDFQVDASTQSTHSWIQSILPFLSIDTGKSSILKDIDFRTLVEITRIVKEEGVYAYIGSLTTPPCTEGIKWFIVPRAIELPSSALAQFWKAMPKNARYTQSTNGH